MTTGAIRILWELSLRHPNGPNSISTSSTSATAASVPSTGRYARVGSTEQVMVVAHVPISISGPAKQRRGKTNLTQREHLLPLPHHAPGGNHQAFRAVAVAHSVDLSVWQTLQAFGIFSVSASPGVTKWRVWLWTRWSETVSAISGV
jgi:hypothetical protein